MKSRLIPELRRRQIIRQFRSAFDRGAPCPDLFEIRNRLKEIDPKHPALAGMNDRLRQVGCYSATSGRTR